MSSLKNPLLNSISYYIKKGHRILILSLLFKRLSCFPSNLFVNVTLEKSILTRCFSYMSCMIMQPKNFLLLLPFLYTKVQSSNQGRKPQPFWPHFLLLSLIDRWAQVRIRVRRHNLLSECGKICWQVFEGKWNELTGIYRQKRQWLELSHCI